MGGSGILIVEDERIIALDLSNKVKRLGYTLLGVAHSGPDAVRMAEELAPDLVLMDIMLDGSFDGIEAARRIRLGRQVPVVFVSACNDQPTLERARAINCRRFVSKPVDPADLDAKIRESLAECALASTEK
ncbi:putative transcriptional regulatory protein pdtaR [Fundidesulfovibrio magnetotacticus]|uniref:Putative transcriptional regulatory protein pdtaR n=1 Tax=Fundidesulfovibrio magnetotacticus TaxID=2730080 RepID=A0A6V8LUP5_9BACT|nr:response regulator [Fundidesulfovibrio magnetotacticus]GFK93536.1 putative transcriptional regulatory protein pdtaR [Fundidesulfovibrio magnetotacticus]